MAGKQQEDDDEKAEKAAAAAKEQQDELRRMVVGTVKEQVAKAMKALDIGKLVTEAVTPLLEGLKPAGDEGTQGAGKGAVNGLPPEIKAAMDKLAADNKKLQDRLDGEQRTRTELEAKSRRKEERDALGAALRKAGVPDALAAGAVAYLHGDKAVIKRNEDGAIQWAQGDEAVDLDAGVAAWIKSGEGKSYLPPRQVNGSGGGRGTPGASGANGKPNKGEQILDDIAFLAGMPDFGPGS